MGQRVKSCKGECWFQRWCYLSCQSDNDLRVPDVYFFLLKTLTKGKAPSEYAAADCLLSCIRVRRHCFPECCFMFCYAPACSNLVFSSVWKVRLSWGIARRRPGAFPPEPILLWLSTSFTWTQVIREMMHLARVSGVPSVIHSCSCVLAAAGSQAVSVSLQAGSSEVQ